MNPSEKNKLFEKYMSGDISRSEMHRLNEYALDDDFLFEALEGASNFEENNAAYIQDLEVRLEEKAGKKRKPLAFWMSIAAGIAILVFAVTYIQVPTQDAISDVVMESHFEPAEDFEDSAVNSGPEEESVDKEPQEEKGSLANISSLEPPKSESIESAEPTTAVREIASDASTPQPKRIESPAVKLDQVTDEGDKLELNEKIAASKILRIPQNRDIGIKETVEADLEERTSERSIVTADVQKNKRKASAPVSPSYANMDLAKKRVSPSGAISIPENLPKIESSGLGSTAISTDDSTITPKVEIVDDVVTTILFREYVLNELGSVEFSGEFVVEIVLKGNMILEESKVVKSINPTLDAKLLDLVESYPDWKGSGNKTIKITLE